MYIMLCCGHILVLNYIRFHLFLLLCGGFRIRTGFRRSGSSRRRFLLYNMALALSSIYLISVLFNCWKLMSDPVHRKDNTFCGRWGFRLTVTLLGHFHQCMVTNRLFSWVGNQCHHILFFLIIYLNYTSQHQS